MDITMVRAVEDGKMKPIMGDVVRVTKIAERDIEYRHEKDDLGYGYTRVLRVLRVYPTEPILAVVVGMRNVHTGEIVDTDDEGGRTLKPDYMHTMYLVRTGPMNREVLVPPDGLRLASRLDAQALRDELIKGRLRRPTFTKVGEGATLKCSDEAMMVALLARGFRR